MAKRNTALLNITHPSDLFRVLFPPHQQNKILILEEYSEKCRFCTPASRVWHSLQLELSAKTETHRTTYAAGHVMIRGGIASWECRALQVLMEEIASL